MKKTLTNLIKLDSYDIDLDQIHQNREMLLVQRFTNITKAFVYMTEMSDSDGGISVNITHHQFWPICQSLGICTDVSFLH